MRETGRQTERTSKRGARKENCDHTFKVCVCHMADGGKAPGGTWRLVMMQLLLPQAKSHRLRQIRKWDDKRSELFPTFNVFSFFTPVLFSVPSFLHLRFYHLKLLSLFP